jgi:hypothetical protein
LISILVASIGAAFVAAAIHFVVPAIATNIRQVEKIDWAFWTLNAYIFGYFVFAAMHWYAEFTGHEPFFNGARSVLSKLLRLLFAPLFMPMLFIHFVLQGFVLVTFVKFLHEDSKRIALRSFNVLLLIWISIYGILLFTNLWQQKNACSWVFPRILTCLLTNYQDLSGGLIGAGGTIFAAWIAWIAVQEQFRQTKADE